MAEKNKNKNKEKLITMNSFDSLQESHAHFQLWR